MFCCQHIFLPCWCDTDILCYYLTINYQWVWETSSLVWWTNVDMSVHRRYQIDTPRGSRVRTQGFVSACTYLSCCLWETHFGTGASQWVVVCFSIYILYSNYLQPTKLCRLAEITKLWSSCVNVSHMRKFCWIPHCCRKSHCSIVKVSEIATEI